MINNCDICNEPVKTILKIRFDDLQGADSNTYYQHVGMCNKCGFLFTQNPFTDEQLENRYKNLSKFEFDDKDYILDDGYAKRCLRQKHFLEENLDFSKIETILEVGAASGYNLSLYKSEGITTYGIEPSSNNCKLAKKNYDVDLFNGMVQDYLDQNQNIHFDLIFMSMVLEHIVNPKTFIDQIKRVSNNFIFIEVPTLDIRSVEEPFGIFCEEHVNLFTLDSLNKMMNSCGYQLINVENVYGLGLYLPAGFPAMMTIWEKKDGIIPNNTYNVFSTEEMINKYIGISKKSLSDVKSKIDSIPKDEKIAVWGVGHHASMLLANTSLAEKNIVRVYDSDKRKENTVFAGVPIKPFVEEDIYSGKVESILLTTYTAQKAIIKYINKLNIKCKIYTLYDI